MIHLKVSLGFTLLILAMVFGALFIPMWHYYSNPRAVEAETLSQQLLMSNNQGVIDSQHLLLYQAVMDNKAELTTIHEIDTGIATILGTIATYFGIQVARKSKKSGSDSD